MTAAARLRLAFWATLVILAAMLFGPAITHTTRPQDNRPKPGPTAPPRPR